MLIEKIEFTTGGGIRIIGPLVNAQTGKIIEEVNPDDPF